MTVYHCEEQLIAGPCGELELLHSCPKGFHDGPFPYAVICHPHPVYGGTMANKVVYTIASTFNALGAGVVRFNFRGVGKSAGIFDHGIGETEDLCAVVAWVAAHHAPSRLWLAGFSFGSYIALRGQGELKADRLLLVAPAVERFDFAALPLCAIPTLVIQGDLDNIVSPRKVAAWVATQVHQPYCCYLPKADHFFHGQLTPLRETITKVWSYFDGNHL